ncbi:ABC transporter permease [Thermomonospora umbrina]|uniref:Putative ABC transport system permease protein n=1 Tax=Thermomonospora umbrina TaxID=111806 RepID=A0A3D9SI20_9ACTN|nr:ABC transporter permease [Thermomonospora umbrina]REE95559.1 putative ABC transport system permease protein [Thermomonospora umbrina]
MIRLALREMGARKRRLIGSLTSVFLGVSFLAGTLVLADTLQSGINGFFTDAYAGTDVSVRSSTRVSTLPGRPRGMIDGSVVERVRRVPGVAAAEPMIQGNGQILRADGRPMDSDGPRNAGNWVADTELNPYRIVAGRAPRTVDEVVINKAAADDAALKVGDRTVVLTPSRVPVTIVGISRFGEEDALGGSTFAAFTLEGARRHIAQGQDRVTGVAVRAASGVDDDDLLTRVRSVLPAGTEALTGTALAEESMNEVNEQFIGVFRMAMLAFAGVALLVAAFSIHNTFSIQMAQRTRESALLRALGAGRGQVLALVAIEALAVGVAATVAGLAGGYGVAVLLKELFAAAGMGFPVEGVVFKVGTVLIAAPVGVIVTALAVVVPVLKASRVAPLAALRESAAERPNRRSSESRALIGVSLGLVGGGAVVWGGLAGAMPITAAGALTCTVVMVLLAPIAAGPVSSLLGRPATRLRGVGGGLARRNAMRNPRRTAGAATALMIGIGVVTLLTVFAGSMRASLEDEVAGSFRGELVVNSGNDLVGGLDPALAERVAALPQVASAAGLGRGDVVLDGKEQDVTVADPARLGRVLRLDVEEGRLGGFAISRDAADDHGWKVGTAVPVTFADGARTTQTVTAIYGSPGPAGDYLLPRSVWSAHERQALDMMTLVDLRDGASMATAKTAIGEVVRPYGAPEVQDRAEFVAAQTENMNAFLTVVYVMLALAILIALLGIANTLAQSIHERTRELGLLRAVGATRGQIRSMVRWESVIVALFGTAGGVALGLFLGWGLAGAALDSFAAPPVQLAVIALVGGLTGVLAAIRPARRAARLDALTAIAAP